MSELNTTRSSTSKERTKRLIKNAETFNNQWAERDILEQSMVGVAWDVGIDLIAERDSKEHESNWTDYVENTVKLNMRKSQRCQQLCRQHPDKAEAVSYGSITKALEVSKELPISEPTSQWWDGFDEDDPAAASPEPAPVLPTDEVVWEDNQEQASVLEPEEKRERLSTKDKLRFKADELELRVQEQDNIIREQSRTIENDKQRLQLAHDQDRPAAVKDTKLVASQRHVEDLEHQIFQLSSKLRDTKSELNESLRKIKYLAKQLDSKDKTVDQLKGRVSELERQAEDAKANYDPFV